MKIKSIINLVMGAGLIFAFLVIQFPFLAILLTVGILLLLIGGVIFLIVNNKKWSAKPPKLSLKRDQIEVTVALDRIDWYQFEKVIARLLAHEGFAVKLNGGAHADGGIDLIAKSPDGRLELIQCKFWKAWNLDLKTIRELVGARESVQFKSLNATASIYKLSNPTIQAASFADENKIRIVTRDSIYKRLSLVPINKLPELLNPDKKLCPKCDAPMINRGKFWGCSNFRRLNCRGIIEVEGKRV